MLNDEIKTAIDKVNMRFSEGFLKGSASMIASGFADDAVIIPPESNTIQGKRAIEEFWKAVIAEGVREANLSTVELSVSGDFAVERGTGILKIQPQNEDASKQNIKYVIVWRRAADEWKNMWVIWNISH